MEMQTNEPIRTPAPRRRRRSKAQIFKEAYLPTIIMAITIVLVLVFIIGGVLRGKQSGNADLSGSGNPSSSADSTSSGTLSSSSMQNALWEQEAADLMQQAALLAKEYDYAGALAKLNSFSGVKEQFPELIAAITRYTEAQNRMVSWKAEDVYNLSFHVLIANPSLAFTDAVYPTSYKNNFITTTEFTRILEQLYEGGYILVDLDDFYSLEYSSTYGTQIYTQKELLLPEGKIPVMLTETNASYYAYMQNGEQDGKPDGLPSRLCYDGQKFYNEMLNADGSVSTGAYDVVPLLEEFISAHPDFSYKGARAIISFAGCDRILGYRVNDTSLNAETRAQERSQLQATVNALRTAGYKLACYTYNNINYGTRTTEDIQTDLKLWNERVTPLLGDMDILVFAQGGDIASTTGNYNDNSKFNVLHNAGFRYFLGSSDTPFSQVANRYVRHNRLMVTGSNLKNKAALFADLFDVAAVLDEART